MQQLIVNIPDNKLAFFIDLANNLGFTIENKASENILTKKQTELVNEARKDIKENPVRFSKWEDARKTLNTNK